MSRRKRRVRQDGYINLINKWGTRQDPAESYRFQRERATPDAELTTLYTDNGLFARIIDAPAEEALKKGFDLGLNDPDTEKFILRTLSGLGWEEQAAAAIKWARLYGGAIMVMLVDDGRGLEEPLNWRDIRGVDELHVFERPVVQPDYRSLCGGPGRAGRIGFARPEYYDVSSFYGSFRVHESRCLVFRNGVVPESVYNENYRYWGVPEYARIKRALQDAVTAHSNGPKLLEKSVQAVYKMKNLADRLTTEMGETQVLKRLELIDLARSFLNTIAIDAEGEEYDFRTFQFSGVKDVIDATCNMLSALTNIPQTILFGRSPAGESATGESDMESWYSFVERLQRITLKPNLTALLDVIFAAGTFSGDVAGTPGYELKFEPLWSMSDTEQAAVEKTRADTSYVKAQTTQIYVDMQALDPSEVRRRLASDEQYDVEDIIDEGDEESEEDVYGAFLEGGQKSSTEGLPQDGNGPIIRGNGALEYQTSSREDFEESKHPRDKDGKFSSNGSSGSTEANETQGQNGASKPTVDKGEAGASSSEPEGEDAPSSGRPRGLTIGSKKDIDDAIKAGKIKMSLKSSAQSKHRPGTDKYKAAVARGDKVSTVSLSDDEIKSLVTKLSGTGTVYVNTGTGQIREIIECGKTVGTYMSASGQASQTTRLTVHHSKTGFHVVPAVPGGAVPTNQGGGQV